MKTLETSIDKSSCAGARVRPIHVAHIVWTFDIGGMENGLVNLINTSEPTRLRFSVIALTRLGNSQARITASDARFAELNRRLGNDWRVIWRLARLLRQIKPDIVHTHGWGTYLEGVLAARLVGIPAVIHGEHGTTFFEKRRRILTYRALDLWTTLYTTVSPSLQRLLVDTIGIESDRITCIPNGVDTQRFAPKPRLRQKMRTHLSLETDEYVVGTIGRMVPVKGFEVFVEAIRRLVALGVRVRGVLVGDGPLRDTIQQLARNRLPEGLVTFLGECRNVSDILQAFDVFVSTSHNEGMSNTILEAMAIGLPVVATAVGGTPELVHPGETGILVPPNSAARTAEALAMLGRSPESRVRMGRAGMQRCLKEFALTQMIERYDAVYEHAYNTVYSTTLIRCFE